MSEAGRPLRHLGGDGVTDRVDLVGSRAVQPDRDVTAVGPRPAAGAARRTSGNCLAQRLGHRVGRRRGWLHRSGCSGRGRRPAAGVWVTEVVVERQDVAHRRTTPAVDRLERVAHGHDRVTGTEERHEAVAAAPSTCPGTRRAAPSRIAARSPSATSATVSASSAADAIWSPKSTRSRCAFSRRNSATSGTSSSRARAVVAGLRRVGGELAVAPPRRRRARRSAPCRAPPPSPGSTRCSFSSPSRVSTRSVRAVSRSPSAGKGPAARRTTDSASWTRWASVSSCAAGS